MNDNLTNAEKQELVAKMIAGWSGDLPPSMAMVVVRGEELTPPQVVERLGAFHDLLQAPDKARAVLRAAISQRQQGEGAGWTFLADLGSVIRQHHPTTANLGSFGLTLPAPPARPSSETLVLANVQRQDTRKARGIKGSRQRAEITTTPKAQVVVTELSSADPAGTADRSPQPAKEPSP